MGFWSDPWDTFEANDALSLALEQQFVTLELEGEPYYVIQRRWDLPEVVKTVGGWTREEFGFSVPIWRRGSDPDDTFPDPQRCQAWIGEGEGEIELDRSESEQHFVPGRAEYAIRARMRELDAAGEPLPDVVFLVVNAPPHDGSSLVRIKYRPVSPAIDLARREPAVDNAPGFELSLRGWRQWLEPNASFRGVPMPHVIPIAMTKQTVDIQIQAHGPTRIQGAAQWMAPPPPYGPAILVGDILVRRSNGGRYEVRRMSPDFGIGFDGEIPTLKVQVIEELALIDGNDPRHQIPFTRG